MAPERSSDVGTAHPTIILPPVTKDETENSGFHTNCSIIDGSRLEITGIPSSFDSAP